MKQVSSLLHLAALSYSFSVAASSDDFPHVRRGLRSKPDVSFAGMVADYAQNIVGGTAANGTEVPWFVHFGDGSCGGSLISENRVLTAAHCVYSVGAPESVRIGATTPSNGRSAAVTCAKVHPDYDGDVGNDVAILKLSESVTDVPFISLNSDTAYPSTSGQRLTVIGLGRTSTNGPIPSNLLTVDKFYVPDSECDNRIGFGIINSAQHLCADATSKGVCNGDSGGPLFDTNYVQVGIVSFGIESCASEFPDGYTQVSTYYNWIQEQLTDDSCDTLPPPFCPFEIFCIFCANLRDTAVAGVKSFFGN